MSGPPTPPPPPAAEVTLSVKIGDFATVDLVRGRINENQSDSIAILASRSFCPIGRESQTFIPEKSPIDNRLLATFKSLGRKDFGDVLEVETEGLIGDTKLFIGVCPRGNLRRDETKELLLKIMFYQLRFGLQRGSIINFEAIDGNTIFSIPRAQIAEVLFDACWHYCRKYGNRPTNICFATTSKSLLEQYTKVFLKRYEKLTQDLEEAGPFNEENPPSNFMLDIYQDDADFIKTYGMNQKQIYNDCGSAVNIELYDVFVACERRFGRPKAPVLLPQIKAYLREINNATDTQLNNIVAKRQKDCQQVVIEMFEKHKNSPQEFFRTLCVYELQFCKEILCKTIREIASLDNLFLPPSQLSKYLYRYAGEENAEAEKEEETKRSGASRSQSEIFAKEKNSGKLGSGRPKKRKSVRRTRTNLGESGDSVSSAGQTNSAASLTKEIQDETENYPIIKVRLGTVNPPNWRRMMDLLYIGQSRILNLALDITQVADADKVASTLVKIFHYNDDALSLLKMAIKNEVDKTAMLSTLFRQNSMASKMLTTFARMVSKEYLCDILTPCINKVVEAGENLEVDPSRLKTGQSLQSNQHLLREITELLIQSIITSTAKLPYHCRAICNILKEVVEPKFPDGALVAVAGFLVLRLINPALVVPDADGLNILTKEKCAGARRGLLFVSKLIQNLANQVDFKKEEFMLVFNSFVVEKFVLLEDFFLECATLPDLKDGEIPAAPMEITAAQFHESLASVNKQFILNKDKFMPLIDMEPEIMEEFNFMIANPIEYNVAGVPSPTASPAPASPTSDANGKDDKKDKEKKKEEEKKEKEKKKEDEKRKKEEEKKQKEKDKEKEKKDKKDKK